MKCLNCDELFFEEFGHVRYSIGIKNKNLHIEDFCSRTCFFEFYNDKK